jgi:putative addiction module component (TIGR02574 family)
MTVQTEQILDSVLKLSAFERAELVDRILSSFDFPLREDVDAAWAKEVECRIDAYDRGEIESRSMAEVFTDLDEKLAR